MVAGGDFGLCASAAAHAARVRREFDLRKHAREEKKKKKEELKNTHRNKDLMEFLDNLMFSKLDDSEIACVECKNQFKVVNVEDAEFLFCKRCRSHLIQLDQVEEFTRHHKNFVELNFKSRKSKYSCTQCDSSLREYQYVNKFNLLIDYCDGCNYIYLEKGEFERLILKL